MPNKLISNFYLLLFECLDALTNVSPLLLLVCVLNAYKFFKLSEPPLLCGVI